MTEPVVTCPNCHTDIPLTESLAAPLIQATRRQFECLMAEKEREVVIREHNIQEQQTALEMEKAASDQRVSEKLMAERSRIADEEASKAKRLVASDLYQKAKELAHLQLGPEAARRKAGRGAEGPR